MSRCDLCGAAEATATRKLGPLTMYACALCAPRLHAAAPDEPQPAPGARRPASAAAAPGSDLLGTLTQAAQSRERAQRRYEHALVRAGQHYGPSALARAAGVARPTIYAQLARLTGATDKED